MDRQKVHLKRNGKAMCGIKRRKHKLKFVDDGLVVTCKNCLRVVAT